MDRLEKSIVLKNIDTSMYFGEQRYKLIEYREKLTSTVYDYIFNYDSYNFKEIYECKKRAIEELCYMVQTGIGLLQKINVNADKAMENYFKRPLNNIDTSIVFWAQRNKLIEDRGRFDDTIVDCILSYKDDDIENTEKCKKKAIEAFGDMVQTGMGLLQNIGIDADKIMEEYPKHLEKLKK